MDIFHGWSDSKDSVLPIYKKLIAAGLRIWIYRYMFSNSHQFPCTLSSPIKSLADFHTFYKKNINFSVINDQEQS